MTAAAEVTKVDGRRIEFKVSARDEIEEIGNGTHERMVVDMAPARSAAEGQKAALITGPRKALEIRILAAVCINRYIECIYTDV